MTAAYARAYGVDLSEAERSSGVYPTFDAFFTRKLKPDARVISPDRLVCPADGTLEEWGPVEPSGRIAVKGRTYRIAELVGDSDDAARHRGGEFLVVYLSPRDYHRVHSPVDGQVAQVRSIPGDLFPVNRIGERHVPRLLARNRRVAIFIDTPDMGRVTLVMVGALVVGRITISVLPRGTVEEGVHTLRPPARVGRGDEIGIFHLGSTVILFLSESTNVARSRRQVRYGESLLRAPWA